MVAADRGGVVGLAVASLSDRFEPWAGGLVVGLLTAIALTTVSDGLRAIRRPIQRGDDASVAGGYVWLPPRFVQLAQVTLAGALGGWAVWLLASALPVAT